MSRRAAAYPPAGYVLRLPTVIWEAALAIMRAYATRGASELGEPGSEALVYLAGVVAAAELIVTGLYCLDHAPQGDRVVVTPDEARWLLKTLRARDEKLVGQLHSHRSVAGHSPGDDAWATSFHGGFLSIVVPHFGIGVSVPGECAVLEYRGGRFVELSDEEIASRVRQYPQIAERKDRAATDEVRGEGRWGAFVGRLRSIAPERR